jgi:hypothetical protein
MPHIALVCPTEQQDMGFWWWQVDVARAIWGVKDAALQQVGLPSRVVHWRARSNMGRPEIGHGGRHSIRGGTVLEPAGLANEAVSRRLTS